MGCDIHLYQEKRVGGAWVTADTWGKDKYGGPRQTCPWDKRLYSGRNYRLFSVLAGVRNGVGFAGIETGDAVQPIAAPRGVPADACRQYQDEVADWGADGHSHSWVTLKDLTSYSWPKARKTGLVALREWRKWKASGAANPDEWCGDVDGPGIVKVSEDVAANITEPDEDDRIRVRCNWTTNLMDDCKEFLNAAVPRLEQLEAERGAGNARLVFFFDN